MMRRYLNTDRDALLDRMRRMVGETFTIDDLVDERVSRATVEQVVAELARQGIVERIGWRRLRPRVRVRVYRLVAPPPPRERAQVEVIWQAMRIMRTFTVPDLARVTGASPDYIHRLISRLRSTHYLRNDGRLQPAGLPGSYQRYRLVRDPGPNVPSVLARTARGGRNGLD